MSETFVLYTGQRSEAGVQYGGALRMKTGALESAYLGFATEDLARTFQARYPHLTSAIVLNIMDLVTMGDYGPRETHVLRIPDQSTLETYFADPRAFPFGQYLVPRDGAGDPCR